MGAGATCLVQNHILDGIGDGSAKILNKFIDDEFDLEVQCNETVYWVRASQIGCGKLFPGFRDPCINDIVPGRLSNPYFVAAALAIATRNNYLKGHFIAYNPFIGCVAVRLWHNARYEVVIIDDRIPCTINDDGAHIPLFTYCLHGECWCPLLEKALAKLRGGSYNNLNQNNISDLLVDMTGEYVIDAEIKNNIDSNEPIAISSHTARDFDQLKIDLKSMYNDLFNILLTRSAAGNVLICADPITSAFDEQSVVMENIFPCVILEVKQKKTPIESRITTAADFGGMDSKSTLKARSKTPNSGGRHSRRVNFNDTAKTTNANLISCMETKHVVQDETRYVRIASISTSLDSMAHTNKSIVGNDISMNKNVSMDFESVDNNGLINNQASDPESALNWTHWCPIGESDGKSEMPINTSIAFPIVAPIKHSALSMSYSNSNKLAVSADQNTVRKLHHKYKKLNALLDNTSGMVSELPVPESENSSIWMKWSDFLDR